MEERVTLPSGTFSIEANPGRGARVMMEIPIEGGFDE
jgi:signal transduction histidine kinase